MEFRPIALCNVVMKIVMKVLDNRLKEELQMSEADDHSTYLRLQNILGRKRYALLGYPKEKVKERIQNWDGKLVAKSVGISVEHPVAYLHTQNGLGEFLIKRLQLIACPLLLRANLPTSVWGHAILRAANLIRIRPSSYNKQSPHQLALGQIPDVSHFRIFGCVVYVPIAPPQRLKMGPQRRMGIYVGFDSPSIIRYLEPLTGDVFTIRYANYHFDESIFPTLVGDKLLHKINPDLTWNTSGLNALDPRTNQCESEVQRIIHMQNIVNKMPDIFSDSRHIVKLHIPAINAPASVEIPIHKSVPEELINKSKPRQKRGRPIGAKDVVPRKWKTIGHASEVANVPDNTPEVETYSHVMDGVTFHFLIGKDITNVAAYLKTEFEMKDLGKTRFCLGIQVEHLSSGILVHQSTYTDKILDRFYMDKAHLLTTPMVVRSLEVENDPFCPRKENEDPLGPEVPYLSAIGALMYLANNTRPDIAFAVNLLARFSSDPTKRRWDGIKHILRYLRGTIDLGLFFSNNSKSQLVGYTDAGYLSDPHVGQSQKGYLFTYYGTAIAWKSTKQTMAATSSNHAELLAIHEASRECVWLRSIIQHIRHSCGLSNVTDGPTILFEDNSACIRQLKEGYIKGDRTKHILPKFFYTHELQENGDIEV
ncbi:hypothetical protein AgCh_002571 [Apium graveolens]